jgi:nucleotide-binding universal stress UspA family protein
MQREAQTLDQPPAEEKTDLDGKDTRVPVVQGRSTHFQRQGLGQRHHQVGQFISKILVPTDFSPCSERALKFAVSLAQQCRANLTILHVIDINTQSAHGELLPPCDMMERLWAMGFEQMGKLAFSLNGQVDAQTAVEEGLPCEQIIEKSRQTDLLILGKRGPRRGWTFFSKHTAQRVIENAGCPVIVVQDRDDDHSRNKLSAGN